MAYGLGDVFWAAFDAGDQLFASGSATTEAAIVKPTGTARLLTFATKPELDAVLATNRAIAVQQGAARQRKMIAVAVVGGTLLYFLLKGR